MHNLATFITCQISIPFIPSIDYLDSEILGVRWVRDARQEPDGRHLSEGARGELEGRHLDGDDVVDQIVVELKRGEM